MSRENGHLMDDMLLLVQGVKPLYSPSEKEIFVDNFIFLLTLIHTENQSGRI